MPKKSKRARYAERKVNREREVISYEDMPLEDYEQEKTEMSPAAVKKIIIVVCVVLAAGLLVFAFANRDKLTRENLSVWWNYDVLGNAGNGYPVSIIGSEVQSGNFAVNQGRVAYASDTSFVTLNSTGKEIANLQLRYSSPIMKTSENRFLVYGLGETGFQIHNFDSTIFTGKTNSAIYTGDVCSNGVYCLVTEGDGFLTELYVYNKDNKQIFKYSFSEYYVNAVALNGDGSGCVACGITSDGGAMKTCVYALDFGKEEPVAQYTISDDSIIDSKYIGSRRVALVGENASYIIVVGDENYITLGYDDMPLVNYYFNPSSNSLALALSKSGDGRSCALLGYSDRGDRIFSIDSPHGAESLAVYNGTVAVLDGNTAYAYNRQGEVIHACFTGTGSKRIALTSDATAYVLSNNQVRYIDFNNAATQDSAKE